MPCKEEAQHAEGLVQAEQPRVWERADAYWGSSPVRRGEPLPGRGRGAKPSYCQERKYVAED